MLVTQVQSTFVGAGEPPPSVSISDRTVGSARGTGTCHSGMVFSSSGQKSVIRGTGATNPVGSWLQSGANTDFWIRHTITQGTLQVEPGTGWNAMSTTRTYDNQKSSAGWKTTIVYFEIASDAAGVTIVDTATHTYHSEQGYL